MTDILVFSDLHLHQWREFSSIDSETGLNSRLMEGIRALEKILRMGQEVDYILFTGDLFHDGARLHPVVLRETIKVFRSFSLPKQHLFFLPGQHDFIYANGRAHAIELLDDYVTVLPNSGIYSRRDLPFHLLCCTTFTPREQQESVFSSLQGYVRRKPIIFVGHFLLTEFLNEHGLQALPNSFSFERGEVPMASSRFGFLGDFHYFAKYKDREWYSVGGAMHHTFSDIKRRPGSALLYTLETEKLMRCELQLPEFIVCSVEDYFRDVWRGPDNYYRVHTKDEDEIRNIRAGYPEGKIRFVLERERKETEVRMDINTSMEPRRVLKEYCDYMDASDMLEKGIGYLDEAGA